MSHVLWPAAGFFFDFKPGVDIIGKEPFLSFREMPHFVDVENLVSLLHSLVEFWPAPGPGNLTLFVSMASHVASF